jgi:hypothetical protein
MAIKRINYPIEPMTLEPQRNSDFPATVGNVFNFRGLW